MTFPTDNWFNEMGVIFANARDRVMSEILDGCVFPAYSQEEQDRADKRQRRRNNEQLDKPIDSLPYRAGGLSESVERSEAGKKHKNYGYSWQQYTDGRVVVYSGNKIVEQYRTEI